MSARRKVRRVRLTRDLVTFCLGLGTFGYQAFVVDQVNQVIVGACVLFILGPAASRLDDRLKDKAKEIT